MLLPIVQLGDPVLRQKCAPVEKITEEIISLAENMVETMEHAHGVGLAAPQIGQAIRLAVIDVSIDPECVNYFKVNGEEVDMLEFMPLAFINPELELVGKKDVQTEGCLSIIGVRAPVGRPFEVKVKCTLINGEEIIIETDGLLARAFQHEIDHLDGILFLDRLSPNGRMAVKRQMKHLEGLF